MRCAACNRLLTDYEATRRHAVTNEFLDLCQQCFVAVTDVTPLHVRDRKDLLVEEDVTQELLDIDNDSQICYNENFNDNKEV